MKGRCAFFHQLQSRRRQRLDTRLNLSDPGLREHLQVFFLQVCLYLVKNNGFFRWFYKWKNLLQVILGKNVVDALKNQDLRRATEDVFELFERQVRVHRAVRHTVTVQSAEGAVRALAPPAAPRRFKG